MLCNYDLISLIKVWWHNQLYIHCLFPTFSFPFLSPSANYVHHFHSSSIIKALHVNWFFIDKLYKNSQMSARQWRNVCVCVGGFVVNIHWVFSLSLIRLYLTSSSSCTLIYRQLNKQCSGGGRLNCTHAGGKHTRRAAYGVIRLKAPQILPDCRGRWRLLWTENRELRFVAQKCGATCTHANTHAIQTG